MVTPADIERAYFYANTCTGQFEKAVYWEPGLTYEEWLFYRFTWEYCTEVLGERYYQTVDDVMYDLKP